MIILSIIQPVIPLAAWFSLASGILLLFVSAYVSCSETAFFSLSPTNKEELEESNERRDKLVLSLLAQPQRLLATILIINNFVNIVITLLLAYCTSCVFDFGGNQVAEFVVETIVIAFLLLLFGEITPKVWATVQPLQIVRFTCKGLQIFEFLVYPFASLLMRSTSVVEHRMDKHPHQNLSMDELHEAVELTDIASEEEKDMLEGITRFGSREVQDIMSPRLDIVDIDLRSNFKEVLKIVTESGYSRIPVYQGTSDKIRGILYSKDLIPHLNKPASFRWQTLVRPAYFVPESKKLFDLFREFQEQKVHMAIVVDEYGGIAGLITMENILEEIVGEITDEHDEEETFYTKLADNVYLLEGKLLLNDFFRALDIDEEPFEESRGEAETLAGFLLELKGDFPKRGEKIRFENYEFEIVAMDKRRIETIKCTINT